MNKIYSALIILLIAPHVASAQGSLQTMLVGTLKFFNSTLIPFLMAIGFLFFVINVLRFFIIGGSNEEGQEKAKRLAIYGVAAFVMIVTFWGIINLIASSIGLDGCTQPLGDYQKIIMSGDSDYVWAPDCP